MIMDEILSTRNVNRLSTDDLRRELTKRGVHMQTCQMNKKKSKHDDTGRILGRLIKLKNVTRSSSGAARLRSSLKVSLVGLQFVDFQPHDDSVILRFSNPENASDAMQKFNAKEFMLPFEASNNITFELLSGSEESSYLDALEASQMLKESAATEHKLLLQHLTLLLSREEHRKRCTGENPVAKQSICEVCQTIFASKNELFRHLRTHAATKSDEEASHKVEATLADKCDNSDKVYYPNVDIVNFQNLVFPIAYEDDYVKVIVKPQGIPTMVSMQGIFTCVVPQLSILVVSF
jgi:hypothetical protein